MEIAGIVRSEGCSWDVRLRFSNALLHHGQLEHAKRFIDGFDAESFFIHADNAAQIHLMSSVLIRTGRVDRIVSLLGMEDLSERFGPFIALDTRLKAAGELLRHEENEKTRRLIEDVDVDEGLIDNLSPEQITLLVTIIVKTGQPKRALQVLEKARFDRFNGFVTDKILLSTCQAMLMKKRPRLAESLAERIDAVRFLEKASNQQEVRLLLTVMASTQRCDEILHLMEKIKHLKKFNELKGHDLALTIAHMLIDKGRGLDAFKMISGLGPEMRINTADGEKYGKALLRLKKYKELERFLLFCDQEGAGNCRYNILRTMYHRCRWQFHLAAGSIKKADFSKYDTVSEAVWAARLLNLEGNHLDAAETIDPWLTKGGLSVNETSSLLYEKGFSLRSVGEIENSLACFDQVMKLNRKVNHWVWMCHFEYAVTSYFIGNNERAVETALLGIKKRSAQFSHDQNPCIFLFAFLKGAGTKGKCFENASVFAKAWSFPHFPYHIISAVFSAVSLFEGDKQAKAQALMLSLIEQVKNAAFKTVKERLIFLLASEKKPFMDQEFVRLFGELLWPNHAKTSYERNLIFKLAGTPVQ
jgi:tetratricopeptide (TPR) repeat protein